MHDLPMHDIEEAATRLVAQPVRPPTPTAVLERRLRARRHKVGAGLSAVTLAAAAIAAGFLASSSGSGRPQRVVTGPALTPSAGSGAGVTPAGYVRVNYGNASIAVPAGWRVVQAGQTWCTDDIVEFGPVRGGTTCPLSPAFSGQPHSFAQLVDLSGNPGPGAQVKVNGHSGVQSPSGATGGEQQISYPDLGVRLTVAGPLAKKIAGTVGWSAAYLALHPTGTVGVPTGWKTVTYGDLTMRVPPSWPIAQLGAGETDPGACSAAEFQTPQVYEGEGQRTTSCPPTVHPATAGVDGLWIRGYQSTSPQPPPAAPTGTETLRTGNLQVLTVPDTVLPQTQPVLRLLARPSTASGFVSIDIGLGPDPLTASEILASLSTVPQTLNPITGNPSTVAPTTVVTAQAAGNLDDYVSSQAATDASAAQRAGRRWNGALHSSPVPDGDTLVAVAAFSYDPSRHPLQVLRYSNGGWSQVAALGYPQGSPTNSYWLADQPGLSISAADPTGDGRPDFLIPLLAADNTPGAVVSQDGPTGQWRYVPFTGPYPTSDVVGRDPQFQGTTLITTYDDCTPDCAQGRNYSVKWAYEAASGVFWAANPPGWTAPVGATNHS